MSREDPHFRLRIPADLKLRVEEAADRSGRSLNAEILQVLLQFFPPEPTVEELLAEVQEALGWAKTPGAPAYRKKLADALSDLNLRLRVGLEFDKPPHQRVLSIKEADLAESMGQMQRVGEKLARQSRPSGISSEDLIAAIERGFLSEVGLETLLNARSYFESGSPEGALFTLGLTQLNFVDPEKAWKVIEAKVREMTSREKGNLGEEHYGP